MYVSRIVGALCLSAAALIAGSLSGCGEQAKDKPAKLAEPKKQGSANHDEAAAIKEALAKLSPEDRKLAEQQKYCVMQTEELLGSMGTPIKLTIQDTPVFVCCKSCAKDAQADPDKTLKTLAELKSKNKTAASANQ